MSKTLGSLGFAAMMALAATTLVSNPASALSMAECSAKYKAAKTAGTDGGLKWNDFRKAQCETGAAAAPAPAPAKAATTAAKATTAPAPAAPAAATSGNFMADCSAKWKAMKSAKTVPVGMVWKDFVAAKCEVAGATPAAAPAAKATTAATPAAKGAAPAPTAGQMVDKNGKPMSPGRAAAVARQRACGAEWKQLKAANKIPVGQRWPQFWSACNTRLKAQGK